MRDSGVMATIVAMTTMPIREVRDHLSEVVDRVESQHERVIITRNGRNAAVILSPEDLASMEETLNILSDPETMKAIHEGEAANQAGDVVRGTDAIRRLLS